MLLLLLGCASLSLLRLRNAMAEPIKHAIVFAVRPRSATLSLPILSLSSSQHDRSSALSDTLALYTLAPFFSA